MMKHYVKIVNDNVPETFAELRIRVRLHCDGNCGHCDYTHEPLWEYPIEGVYNPLVCDEMRKAMRWYQKEHLWLPESRVRHVLWEFCCDEDVDVDWAYDMEEKL